MNWNIRNDAPVYTQLVDQIARAIILGQFPPGSKLPSVRDFASDAGVNPNTMQRALAELERLELIRTQRTAGRTHFVKGFCEHFFNTCNFSDRGSGAHRPGKAAAGAGRHRRILAGAGAARL